MPDNDLQPDPNSLQGDDVTQPGAPSAPSPTAYSPPAYTGKVNVSVDWFPAGAAPEISAFALPMSAWLKVTATTQAGGMLDPAGVPLQVALSTSMHPSASAAGLVWLDVIFDEDTRLGEVRVPAGTAQGSYYLVWRALLTNDAPSAAAGILQSAVLTID